MVAATVFDVVTKQKIARVSVILPGRDPKPMAGLVLLDAVLQEIHCKTLSKNSLSSEASHSI